MSCPSSSRSIFICSFPKGKALESPIVLCLWSKSISFLFFVLKNGFVVQFTVWNTATFFLSSIIGISLPVTGWASTFSTSGVLDSAANVNVSFLAEKKKNNASFLCSTVPKLTYFKHSQPHFYWFNWLFCVYEPACMYVYHECVWCPPRSERGLEL